MDPNMIATTIGISAATQLMIKGAKAPAKTLNLLWEATIGRINPYLEKSIEEHRKNVLKYEDDIKQEITNIPTDQINHSPDISVLGPALEASKYYIENEEIRKMFAKLIGAEFDLRKSDKIHRSFADIIRQMSSNDARLFPLLPLNGPIAEIRLFDTGGNYYERFGPRDILLIPPTITDNFENNAISLNNLARLGLLELDHVQSILTTSYDAYISLSYYQEAQQKLSQNPDKYSRVQINTASFVITPYGELFKQICL